MTLFDSTCFVITEPAPINAFSLIVFPHIIVQCHHLPKKIYILNNNLFFIY
jgi:hypothetical protein